MESTNLVNFFVIAIGYFGALFALRYVLRKLNLKKIPPPNNQRNQKGGETHQYQHRTSYLDSAPNSDSSIQQSEFRGFFNLASIAMSFFVAGHVIRHWFRQGTLLGLGSLGDLFNRLEVFFFWIGLVLMSLFSVTLQKLFIRFNVSLSIQKAIHGLFLSVIFSSTILFIKIHQWPIVPKASLLAELLVILMKVHSYLANNRYYYMQANKKPEKSDKSDKSDKSAEKKILSTFPKNVSYRNFIEFLLIPTLVYELEYPRTEKIRWDYVFEKSLTGIGIFTVLHVIVDVYVAPILLNSPNESAIEVVAELIIPFTFCYMLVFYMVFDCICNGFAELTRFGDRLFYNDWWNSTTMDEFARNWNRPVHLWLQRHIYLESMETFKLSKMNAVWVTFLFSSILHELFMIIVFEMLRPWLFVSQMTQVPMILLGRDLKGTRIGNYLFWFAIVLGIPMLSVLYCREFYAGKYADTNILNKSS